MTGVAGDALPSPPGKGDSEAVDEGRTRQRRGNRGTHSRRCGENRSSPHPSPAATPSPRGRQPRGGDASHQYI